MASLTHVCMWSEHGWKKMAADEAARIFPSGTVSSHSGLFKCELCGQNVILTNGEKRTRYFKHSAYEKNKDCPERTFGATVNVTYSAKSYELPIRLCNITNNQFELEMGLLYVPQSMLQEQKVQQVIIRLLGNVNTQYSYSFERLSAETITYLSIGNIPAQKYEIISENKLKVFWPRYVKGVDTAGSVFDKETGKKLTEDADVQINKSYYLLCTKKLCSNYRDINIQILCEKKVSFCIWYIYEVKATALSEEAAQFFWKLHCRLTEVPLFFQPVWPVYVETPYVICHNRNRFLLHVLGQERVTTKVFPTTAIDSFTCSNGNGQIISIDCKERQQLISVGRTSVLQYTYLWKRKLDETAPLPVVEVMDEKGNRVDSGIKNILPLHRLLNILSPFDGTTLILKNAVVLEKRNLIAEQRMVIDDIQTGFEIKIFQGLDLVWAVSYERKRKEFSTGDELILKKLRAFNGKPIQISHAIGGMDRLKKYPRVKRWVYKKIREGYMPEDAFQYFRNIVAKLKPKE